MKLRPGRSLLGVAVGIIACAIAAVYWPAAVVGIPLAVALAFVLAVADFLWLRKALKGVTVRRTLPSVIGRGVPFHIEHELFNTGGSAVAGDVRDVLPDPCTPAVWARPIELPAGTPAVVRSEFRIPQRGEYQFGPVWMQLRGRFGLLEGQQSLEVRDAIKVLPEGYCSDENLMKDEADQLRMLDKLVRARHHGVGTEFESLHEFREGDDPRRIDWRATARQRRPIVRRYQVERHRDLMILVDCGRLMGTDAGRGTKLDCAVDAALMLSRVALESGDRCGLGIYDDRVLGYLPPVSGPRSLRTLTESLFDLQTRWRESDFSAMFATVQHRQPKRSLIVVLSDLVDVDTTVRFRSSLARLAQRHVVLFAALRTPLLSRLFDEPIETLLDGTRHAVSYRIQREREKAVFSLKHRGIHVLDVEPDQLTVPLVNQFVQLRQRNLL